MIITGFQLRAAKAILNLEYKRICDDNNISRVTLGRLVNTIDNFEEIRCSAQDALKLYKYFSDKGLLFPNSRSVSMEYETETKSADDNITIFQLIVARTALHLSQRDISQHITGMTRSALQKIERHKYNSYFSSKKTQAKEFISFFNKNGIMFPNNSVVSIKKLEEKN